MSSFAADVLAWTVKAQVKTDEALRAVALELLNRVVLRSPVGNPELWAANQHAMEERRAALAAEGHIGKRTLQARFPLTAGKGYVGGRFRGSWTVTFGEPSTSEPGRIDPTGASTLEEGAKVLEGAKYGITIYLVSNVPYAERLEFGWSKQQPQGIVRVTVAEFQGIVSDVVDDL